MIRGLSGARGRNRQLSRGRAERGGASPAPGAVCMRGRPGPAVWVREGKVVKIAPFAFGVAEIVLDTRVRALSGGRVRRGQPFPAVLPAVARVREGREDALSEAAAGEYLIGHTTAPQAVSHSLPVPSAATMMSSSLVLLASCAALLQVAAGAASPADGGKSVAVVTSGPGSATSRQVVDGVLSMLGVTAPEASSEDNGSGEGDAEAEATKAVSNPGERGIHKKKLWFYHLWHVYSWWAWAFAVVVIKFKVALLIIWGHLTYFIVALIRMLLREVPSWVQLKTAPAPYGPPPAPYGPPPPQYGPQYGQQQQYAAASSYSAYKRRAGSGQAAGADASAGGDLAYAAHTQRK
ncbi:5-oxoprolinase [Frankliniella fusca]|uniref:5-oxoprolinase n=1 Tax=Frankliniella fusca TaxID=407009 RepID=A0AAE1HGA6_9NEOP|nr:5-oxoprolinase [Frankliniella fusca]